MIATGDWRSLEARETPNILAFPPYVAVMRSYVLYRRRTGEVALEQARTHEDALAIAQRLFSAGVTVQEIGTLPKEGRRKILIQGEALLHHLVQSSRGREE
jgi:hypothetical protein